MKNRYGNRYEFEPIGANLYTITGELDHWRYGGQEGESTVDLNNLGFVDPSGGPFIKLGYLIQGRAVVRISAQDGKITLEVE